MPSCMVKWKGQLRGREARRTTGRTYEAENDRVTCGMHPDNRNALTSRVVSTDWIVSLCNSNEVNQIGIHTSKYTDRYPLSALAENESFVQ